MTLEQAARMGTWSWEAEAFQLSPEVLRIVGAEDGEFPFGAQKREEIERFLKEKRAFSLEWEEEEGRRLRLVGEPSNKKGMRGVLIELGKWGVEEAEINELQTQIQRLALMANLEPFVRNMVHEINNPLMVIDGACRRAMKVSQSGDTVALNLSLDRIQHASKTIAYLISSLKDVLIHRTVEDRISRSTEEWMEEVLAFCRRRMEKAGIEFQVIHRDTFSIWAHPVEGVQLLVNLLNNSIEASENARVKKIEVEFFIEQNWACVEVRDWGSGVSAELQDRVFSPYVSTKPGTEVGLGLSHVRRIVRLHRGEVELLQSQNPTRFQVRLPDFERG